MTALLWTLLILYGISAIHSFCKVVTHENESYLTRKDSLGVKVTVLIIQVVLIAWIVYLLFLT